MSVAVYTRARVAIVAKTYWRQAEMIIQNKAEFTGGNRITFLRSWGRIKTAIVDEERITLEVVNYEGNVIALLGLYPKKYEGKVMANLEEQIKKQKAFLRPKKQ